MEFTECKTKMMKEVYRRYKNSDYYGLYSCYDRPSPNKISAYRKCEEMADKFNGNGGKIIGYNCNTFSYGFVGSINGRKAFFYITRDYNRFMYLNNPWATRV